MQTEGGGRFFDGISERYDLLNRVMSLGLDQGWRRKLVAALGEAPRRVLDVATGTADVAVAIAQAHPDAEVVGLDPSRGMLRQGSPKLPRLPVRLLQGDGQRLPFSADTFDACCVSFGIRNFPDRAQGLREMARVVRPGGCVAVLELGEPRTGPLAPFARLHLKHVVPRLGALLSGSREYRYLEESVTAFPPPEQFADRMRACGLRDVRFDALTFGAAHLYRGVAP